MKSPLNSPHRTLLILFTVACLLLPELQADSEKVPDSAKAGGFAEIKDGIHHVDGKPFLKTASWWGANHWMTERTDEGPGTQMSLPSEEVGTERDFYGTSGFSTTYFTFMRADIKRAVEVLKECLVRAKKTNQKVVAHLWTDPSQELRKKYNWTYVSGKGGVPPSNTTVWQSATGKNQLHRFDWENPHPEKPIRSIDIVRNEIAKIYVRGITARQ